MKCVISTEDDDIQSLTDKARNSAGLVGLDLASQVTSKERFTWAGTAGEKKYRIATLDCGMKYNQLRILDRLGCESKSSRWAPRQKKFLEYKPDGLFVTTVQGIPKA